MVAQNSGASVGGTARSNLMQALGRLFGPFFAVVGSSTLVVALLTYCGFMSDFGAYRLAGLPRLSFSLTAMVEQGSDTVIDSLALMLEGSRLGLSVVLLLLLVGIWSCAHSPRVAKWAQSMGLYRLVQLTLIVAAVGLALAMIARVQYSISGEHYEPPAVEQALREAYGHTEFPNPYQRALAIERETYRLGGLMRWVNSAAAWDARAMRPDFSSLQSLMSAATPVAPVGLALRMLAEARESARQVYGWLVLSVVGLSFGFVLLWWWGRSLGAGAGTGPTSPTSRWLAWLQGLHAPLVRLLLPMALVTVALCVFLLPLCHGVLARESLGHEPILVFEGGGRQAALPSGCGRSEGALSAAIESFQEAQREYLQSYPSDEDHGEKLQAVMRSIDELMLLAQKGECVLNVSRVAAVQPSLGYRTAFPEVAEYFHTHFKQLQAEYGVKVGVLLNYPRDGQGAGLLDRVVPRSASSSGQAALVQLGDKSVQESLVLPDLEARRIRTQQENLRADPDNSKAAKGVIFTPSSMAVRGMLELLRDHRMHANNAGVAVTQLGGGVYLAGFDDPLVATQGIVYLEHTASRETHALWPEKDLQIRSAAVTALHLTRQPYKAFRLLALLERERQEGRPCRWPRAQSGEGRAGLPSWCLPQMATTLGYLLHALTLELDRFGTGPAPVALLQLQRALRLQLVALLADEEVSDNVKSAVCTAFTLGGKFAWSQVADEQQFWKVFQALNPKDHPIAIPTCIQASSVVLGHDGVAQRMALRPYALRQVEGLSQDMQDRLQRVAIIALREQGIARETGTLVTLVEEQWEQMSEGNRALVLRLLNDVDEGWAARELLSCALQPQQSESTRLRCVNALGRLDDDYDGDDGTVAGLYGALLEQGASGPPSPAMTQALCQTLKVFKRNRSTFMRRLPAQDPGMARCGP